MSHLIESIAFVGATPWHALGVKCPEGLPSPEFFETAGLGFKVEKRPLFFADGTKVPDAEAIFRADRDEYFATVGDGWTPFQNESVRRLCDALTMEGRSKLHTAGA